MCGFTLLLDGFSADFSLVLLLFLLFTPTKYLLMEFWVVHFFTDFGIFLSPQYRQSLWVNPLERIIVYVYEYEDEVKKKKNGPAFQNIAAHIVTLRRRANDVTSVEPITIVLKTSIRRREIPHW